MSFFPIFPIILQLNLIIAQSAGAVVYTDCISSVG